MRIDMSGVDGPLARQGQQQLVLAVAGDAGDAEDLARSDLEGDALQIGPVRLLAGQVEAVDDQTRLAGLAALATHQCADLGADHELRHAFRGLGLGVAITHHLAAAQDRGAVAERLYLVQLVADVEDRATLRREQAQGFEQLFDLLRRQHRGRFVHDQQPRAL